MTFRVETDDPVYGMVDLMGEWGTLEARSEDDDGSEPREQLKQAAHRLAPPASTTRAVLRMGRQLALDGARLPAAGPGPVAPGVPGGGRLSPTTPTGWVATGSRRARSPVRSRSPRRAPPVGRRGRRPPGARRCAGRWGAGHRGFAPRPDRRALVGHRRRVGRGRRPPPSATTTGFTTSPRSTRSARPRPSWPKGTRRRWCSSWSRAISSNRTWCTRSRGPGLGRPERGDRPLGRRRDRGDGCPRQPPLPPVVVARHHAQQQLPGPVLRGAAPGAGRRRRCRRVGRGRRPVGSPAPARAGGAHGRADPEGPLPPRPPPHAGQGRRRRRRRPPGPPRPRRRGDSGGRRCAGPLDGLRPPERHRRDPHPPQRGHAVGLPSEPGRHRLSRLRRGGGRQRRPHGRRRAVVCRERARTRSHGDVVGPAVQLLAGQQRGRRRCPAARCSCSSTTTPCSSIPAGFGRWWRGRCSPTSVGGASAPRRGRPHPARRGRGRGQRLRRPPLRGHGARDRHARRADLRGTATSCRSPRRAWPSSGRCSTGSVASTSGSCCAGATWCWVSTPTSSGCATS